MYELSKHLQPGSLGVYRAAITSAADPVDSYPIGEHPLMKDFFKGLTYENPRLNKIGPKWEVDTVLEGIISWGYNGELDIKLLTQKLAFLLALSAGTRCSELAHLDAQTMIQQPDGVTFHLTTHKKNTKSSKLPGSIFFPTLPSNIQICPVNTIDHYYNRTIDHRMNNGPDKLFRAMTAPHEGVTPKTISTWIKQCIKETGGGLQRAHSVRAKAAEEASKAGLTTQQIMKAQGWRTESVYKDHYYKPAHNSEFGRATLQDRHATGRRNGEPTESRKSAQPISYVFTTEMEPPVTAGPALSAVYYNEQGKGCSYITQQT